MQRRKNLHQKSFDIFREQLHSQYFVSEEICFLNIIPVNSGLLLFYSMSALPFSLGVSLLDKDANSILGQRFEPLWRNGELVKVLSIKKVRQTIKFDFELAEEQLSIYFSVQDLLATMQKHSVLKKPIQNPILKPDPSSAWESQAVFNPGVLLLDNKIHFIYRAIGHDGQSVLGYAASSDGIHIDTRLPAPIFPMQDLHVHHHGEKKTQYHSGGNCCGVEDPRLVKIEDTIYMSYTVFDGYHAPGIYLTSISVKSFLEHNWCWTQPVRLSAQKEIHKNWVIFPLLMQDGYAILHSITPTIQIDYFASLDFTVTPQIKSKYASEDRTQVWDSWVRGVGPVPLYVNEGWLVLYHAMDHRDPNRYKLGAMILDHQDPTKILYRASTPLLEPNEHYENEGFKSGVLYSCGAIIKDQQLFVYYGGADTVVCVAFADINLVIEQIKQGSTRMTYDFNS